LVKKKKKKASFLTKLKPTISISTDNIDVARV
jgi:hypothetical protein